MSRSDNTMPYRIQRQDRPSWTHWMAFGGMLAGVGRDANFRERTARQRARLALARGVEPEPTRHRGSARYDYY